MAFSSDLLWAHGVYIFGWAEGDQICTDSYFTRTDKVQGGVVKILQNDQVLAEGQTNDQGEACFPRPKVPGDLVLVVEAGEGHRADFNLRAADLPPLTEETPPAPVETGAESPKSLPQSTARAAAVSLDEVRTIVRDELRVQLSPFSRALAESQTAGAGPPSLREIVGGLGWILGVFGLVFFLSGRKKVKN
jgi:nickel transport protein